MLFLLFSAFSSFTQLIQFHKYHTHHTAMNGTHVYVSGWVCFLLIGLVRIERMCVSVLLEVPVCCFLWFNNTDFILNESFECFIHIFGIIFGIVVRKCTFESETRCGPHPCQDVMYAAMFYFHSHSRLSFFFMVAHFLCLCTQHFPT